jgi:hypothetical protein
MLCLMVLTAVSNISRSGTNNTQAKHQFSSLPPGLVLQEETSLLKGQSHEIEKNQIFSKLSVTVYRDIKSVNLYFSQTSKFSKFIASQPVNRSVVNIDS